MELFDHILGELNLLCLVENQFQDVIVSGDFLFVTGFKRCDGDIIEQLFDLFICQHRALNTSWWADTLDGSNPSKFFEVHIFFLLQNLPFAFESVNMGNLLQNTLHDFEGKIQFLLKHNSPPTIE